MAKNVKIKYKKCKIYLGSANLTKQEVIEIIDYTEQAVQKIMSGVSSDSVSLDSLFSSAAELFGGANIPMPSPKVKPETPAPAPPAPEVPAPAPVASDEVERLSIPVNIPARAVKLSRGTKSVA